MLLHDFIVIFSIVWIDLVLPSCLALPAVITPLNSENGKKLFRSTIEEVLHDEFPSISKLSKEVFDLDSEFDIWKTVLLSATAVGLLIIVIFCIRFQKKNNKKLLEISKTLVDFKDKIVSMENSIDNIITRCNRNSRTNSS
jgi:hypothetical protein